MIDYNMKVWGAQSVIAPVTANKILRLTYVSIHDRLKVSTRYRQMKQKSEGVREMENYTLGVIESRFADIIWQHAPLSTSELIRICEEELEWKRTTTYTVLKKLSERGLFENQAGTVVVRISREEFYARQSECYIEQSFQGSLPQFLTAFTSRRKLSEAEIVKLQKIIEENK